jgi:hypothetical protein
LIGNAALPARVECHVVLYDELARQQAELEEMERNGELPSFSE